MRKLILLFTFLFAINSIFAQEPGTGERRNHLWYPSSANVITPLSSDWDVDVLASYLLESVELGLRDKIIYVDANTTVTATGSFNAPYSTISLALAASSSGDLIYVAPGTYNEHVTFTETNVALTSSGGPGVTYIDAIIVGGAGIDVVDSTTITGFTITGDAGGAIIQLDAGEIGCNIVDNVIDSRGSATFGISVGASGSDWPSILSNIFWTNTGDGAIWMEKNNTNVRIDGNTFWGDDSTSGYAVQMAGINTGWITNNFIDLYASGIFPHTATSASSGTYNLVIDGNVIQRCSKGIRLGHNTQTVNMDSIKVTNNTLYLNSRGLFIDDDATILVNTFDIVDNRFISNTTNYANDHSSLVPRSLSNWLDDDLDISGNMLIQPTKKFFLDGGDHTSIHEVSDNRVNVELGGTDTYVFHSGFMGCVTSGRTRIMNENVTATNTGLAANGSNDDNTGPAGWANPDQGTYVSGGVEVQRMTEGDGEVSTVFSGTVVETITDASSAGDATLTKAGENFDVTCSEGDAVLIYGGTTAGDYGTYIIVTVTSATVLTLDRALAGSDADVDFDVIADGVLIENSTDTGIATLRTPGDVFVGGDVSVSGANFNGVEIVTDAEYNPSALTNDYKIKFKSLTAGRNCIISTEDRDSGTLTLEREIVVKNDDDDQNVTVSLETAGTIEGQATIVLTPGQSITIGIDGTNASIY